MFLHDIDGTKSTQGLLRNLQSIALTDASDLLGKSLIVVQVSTLFIEVLNPDEWIYTFRPWQIDKSSWTRLVFSILVDVGGGAM